MVKDIFFLLINNNVKVIFYYLFFKNIYLMKLEAPKLPFYQLIFFLKKNEKPRFKLMKWGFL